MALLHLESLPRRVTKADLLKLLTSVGGIERRRVGRIDLHGVQAVVEVPEGWDTRLSQRLDGQTLGNRRVRAWAASSGTGTTEDSHFDRLARLLELEVEAENAQAAERASKLSAGEAERSGTSLIDLAIVDEETGLGGRHLLRLVKRHRGPLPWTRLDVGSPVRLSPMTGGHAGGPPGGHRGIVHERTAEALGLALERELEDIEAAEKWRLDLASDETSIRRQQAALRRAAQARGDRLAELRAILLGERRPDREDLKEELGAIADLNADQLQAVRLVLESRDLALIHGPPGTGKTTTVVACIREAVRRGDKVLACAPSNLGVDNIFERLLAGGQRAVRLGHPARVLPELRSHTLDHLVQEHADVRLARKLVKEAWGLFRRANRTTRAKPEPGMRRETRDEARSLLADARRLESQAVENILDQADVLCATTTALNDQILGTRRFDIAVVDEACQSSEPGCWIPLLRSDRLVLAGDHCQLPPTIVSQAAAAEGLGVSLFERLMTLYETHSSQLLTTQYRMHTAMMDFSSEEFYHGRLKADASVAAHVLADLDGVQASELTRTPAEFIDTAGAGFDEEPEPDGESRLNPGEADFVAAKVRQLLAAGVAPAQLAVIAPYAAQVRRLRQRLPIPELEIDSVDGFQGREKEAVVIGLVRSNAMGEVGFLADIRRMNVALTRARRKLIVIGDSATLAAHPFYRRMVDYFERMGGYRTVWQEDGWT